VRWERATVAAGGDAAGWEETGLPAFGSDDEDHWFRTEFVTTSARTLRLGGLASVCDVFLDGRHVLQSDSMFLSHELPVEAGEHQLAICARALTPLLAVRRRPRARWRTRVAADGNLRWIRTTLLGRAPGFAPGPPLVGPWRPVELVDPNELHLDVRTSLEDDDGVVEVRCDRARGPLEVTVSDATASLPPGGGRVVVPRPERWWPHTHGTPVLHDLHVRSADGETSRRVGFRELRHAPDGVDLRVNGVPVFARGAVWVPPPRPEVRATVERARDAGLNLLRVVGTTLYEDAAFHDACDELGVLVWQDLMFANMDYPFADDEFRVRAEQEVAEALAAVAGRPSLAVVCGNSEVEQQVSMLGLPAELGRDAFFATTVPAQLDRLVIDAPYVPSAPTGGVRPFRTDGGVANYFGVGAYLRPLEDVRRASVRFASECLAFANVPDGEPSDRAAGVMRDVGADWDFADVRDHYLRQLYGLAFGDPDYWPYARLVTGELMAEVLGEWRRKESPSTGAIVLWLRDLAPGAGWGLLDHAGKPKQAWHHVRRALAPVAVWLVDEGLNGLAVHVANDLQEPLRATLRLALYRDAEVRVGEAEQAVELGPHAGASYDVEALLGRFVDVTYAYRFGEPQQDTVVATVEHGGAVLSQAFYYPQRGRRARCPAGDLGFDVSARRSGEGVAVDVSSRRGVRAVRLRAPGWEPSDDAFDVEPGGQRTVELRPAAGAEQCATALRVEALDLSEPLDLAM
jgi:beta-mannosidase